MHSHVEEHEESGMTSTNKLEEDPTNHWHNSVMNNMKWRELIVLFPKHKKERVHEVGKLWKEVPPDDVGST